MSNRREIRSAMSRESQIPNPESRLLSQSRIPNLESRLLNDSRLHVSAALLRDAHGRVLLAQRPEGKAHAGLWEYPGGKVEAGETPARALARELAEELGIAIDADECRELIRIPHAYGERRLWLHVLQVPRWQGEPQPHEAQALRWCEPGALAGLPMPSADKPVAAALLESPRYAITPEPGEDHAAFLAGFEALLAQGHRRVQLRAPRLDADALRALARDCAALAKAHQAELLINGAIDVARELGLGLHLRSAQLHGFDRAAWPQGLPLAVSCHDADELAAAEALGVDFAVLGPLQRTASHPDAVPLGWEGFALARERCGLPVYALGGLGNADLTEARRHGAQGVAAIRAFWPAID
jgi:8-oxo-dGTP diphosphatase